MNGNVPEIRTSFAQVKNVGELTSTQKELIATFVSLLLAEKVGGRTLKEYPLILEDVDLVYCVSLALDCDGVEDCRFYVDKLFAIYKKQEDRRYVAWLQEILGETTEVGLIGDIDKYKAPIDMHRRGGSRDKEWLLEIYNEAQIPKAHRFLYNKQKGERGGRYLEYKERIEQVRMHDAEVLNEQGLDFQTLGETLRKIFRGEDKGFLREDVAIKTASRYLSRIHCPFPHCDFEVYSKDGHPEEYFTLTDSTGRKLEGECIVWHLAKAHRLIRCARVYGDEKITAESLLKFLK